MGKTLEIHPSKEENKEFLQALIEACPKEEIYLAGKVYSINLPDKPPLHIKLKHHVLPYKKNGKTHSCYAVLDQKPFAEGGTAIIYQVLGTWKVDAGNWHYSIKPNDKEWLFKAIRLLPDEGMEEMSEEEKLEEWNIRMELAQREFAISSALPHLRMTLQPLEIGNRLFLRMRRVGQMDLFDVIDRFADQPNYFSTSQKLLACWQMWGIVGSQAHDVELSDPVNKGISGKIVHADIKPENVAVKVGGLTGNYSLLDNGYSCLDTDLLSYIRGTLQYLDPAVLCGKNSDMQADDFSMALTIAEFLGNTSRHEFADYFCVSDPRMPRLYAANRNIKFQHLFSHMPDLDEDTRKQIYNCLQSMTRASRVTRMPRLVAKKKFEEILNARFASMMPQHYLLSPYYKKSYNRLKGMKHPSDNDTLEIYREFLALEVFDRLLGSQGALEYVAKDLEAYLSRALQSDIKLSQILDEWRKDITETIFNSPVPADTPKILKSKYIQNKALLKKTYPLNAEMIEKPLQQKALLDSLSDLARKFQALGKNRIESLCKILLKDKSATPENVKDLFVGQARKMLLSPFCDKQYPEAWGKEINTIVDNLLKSADDSAQSEWMQSYHSFCKLVNLIHHVRDFPEIRVESLVETAQKSSKIPAEFYKELRKLLAKSIENHLQRFLAPTENASGFTLFTPRVNPYAELFCSVPQIIASAKDANCSAKSMLIQAIHRQKILLNEKGSLEKCQGSLDTLLQTFNSEKSEGTSLYGRSVMDVIHRYACF